MNIYVKRALQTAVCAAGLWALGNAVASAETVPPPAIQVPVTAPITVAGNSVALLDGLPPIASVNLNAAVSANASINVGNVVSIPVNVAVVVTHNPITVGNSAQPATPAPVAPAAPPARSGSSGSLVNAPVSVPVLVCGNSVGVLADTTATCGDGATGPATTAGSSGAATGTTAPGSSPSAVDAPVTVPVLVCGNGVGVLGNALAACSGFASGSQESTAPADQTGDGATLLALPVTVPVLVCGNGVGVLGDAASNCGTTAGGSGNDPTDPGTDPISPIVSIPVTVPVNVCGTGIGLLGDASASCGTTPTIASVPAGPGQPSTVTQHPRTVDVLRSTAGDGVRNPLSEASTSLAFTGVGSLGLITLAVGLLVGGGLLASAGMVRRRPVTTGRQI